MLLTTLSGQIFVLSVR